jgi:hypothetical protein
MSVIPRCLEIKSVCACNSGRRNRKYMQNLDGEISSVLFKNIVQNLAKSKLTCVFPQESKIVTKKYCSQKQLANNSSSEFFV